MNHTDDIKCPHCQSANWNCYDEHTEWFESAETGELYEAPVGFLKCSDCNTAYAHHFQAPDEWVGDHDAIEGWR